ncbi:MAG: alpha/beta hydrolase, partial [Lachnospiraceae bacterium]|nr:alpha/beta hydrolase [Lachnospiraceae bacterium]
MITMKIKPEVPGSLETSEILTYIIEEQKNFSYNKRPAFIICPGGGYEYCSVREAEPLALQALAMGYHAFVLNYSCAPARYPVALTELGFLVKLLYEKKDEWNIDTDRIFVMGSSAGGHLAASYACLWNTDVLKETLSCGKDKLKIAGILLNYPVITSGEFAHHGSFKALLGERYEELK